VARARGGSRDSAATSHLVRGDDPSLVAQAVRRLLTELAGEQDPATVVEEYGAGGTEDIDVGAVVDALTTAPFLTPLRIVVVRDAGRLGAPDAARLADCLSAPVPGVVLVLAGGGGTIPAGLVRAVEKTGSVTDTSVRAGRDRSQWLAAQLRGAPVRLSGGAAGMLEAHLGGDLHRVAGLLDTLEDAYGADATVGEEELAPFLGEAGRVAPWDLTDAIDAGDTGSALAMLGRLLGAGDMHALAVLAILHRHYQAMLRLDGAAVSSAEEAAELTGMRSAYPAKKAMEQARQLGSARIGRAIELLAAADLDLRGRSGLGDEVILEVLVARLSRLGGTRQGAAAGRRRR
jgi:DNA polymerase-3 subunit delta